MYRCLNEHERGDYAFDGICLPSSAIQCSLPPNDLHHIRKEIKRITRDHHTDYILIFENEESSRVLAIANISEDDKKQLRTAGYAKDVPHHNYYTLVYDNRTIEF